MKIITSSGIEHISNVSWDYEDKSSSPYYNIWIDGGPLEERMDTTIEIDAERTPIMDSLINKLSEVLREIESELRDKPCLSGCLT